MQSIILDNKYKISVETIIVQSAVVKAYSQSKYQDLGYFPNVSPLTFEECYITYFYLIITL